MNPRHITFAVLATASISTSANSATPTTHAGSGLLMMPTAEVLKSGENYFSLNMEHRSYIVSGSSANNSELQITPGYLIGFADRFELGISAAQAQDVSEKNSALRNIIGTGKLQFISPDNNGLGIALSAYSTLYKADIIDNIGSDDTNYGAEINFTWLSKDVGYHLSMGGGKTDVKTTSPSVSYFSDSFASVSLGIEIKPTPNLAISVEANANRKNDLNNIVLMPGLKYTSSDNNVYSLGIGYSIPNNRAEPEYRFLAGISFGFGNYSAPPTDNRLSNFEQQLLDVDNRITALEAKKLTTAQDDNLQQELQALKSRIRVEIINTSGIDVLGNIVAEKLRDSGYKVIQLISDAQPPRRETRIYYREGLSRFATELGHTLPGDHNISQVHKIISQRYNVPTSTDLIVFIGADLLEPLMK